MNEYHSWLQRKAGATVHKHIIRLIVSALCVVLATPPGQVGDAPSELPRSLRFANRVTSAFEPINAPPTTLDGDIANYAGQIKVRETVYFNRRWREADKAAQRFVGIVGSHWKQLSLTSQSVTSLLWVASSKHPLVTAVIVSAGIVSEVMIRLGGSYDTSRWKTEIAQKDTTTWTNDAKALANRVGSIDQRVAEARDDRAKRRLLAQLKREAAKWPPAPTANQILMAMLLEWGKAQKWTWNGSPWYTKNTLFGKYWQTTTSFWDQDWPFIWDSTDLVDELNELKPYPTSYEWDSAKYEFGAYKSRR